MSYGARATSASPASRRSAPIARPNSGPETDSPRSPSHRVSGRSSARFSAGNGDVDSAVSTAQQVSNTGTASGGIGAGTVSTEWPSEFSSPTAFS